MRCFLAQLVQNQHMLSDLEALLYSQQNKMARDLFIQTRNLRKLLEAQIAEITLELCLTRVSIASVSALS